MLVFTPELSMMSNCENIKYRKVIAQPAFICSKLTIETLEQGVKYVQN